MPLLYSLQCNKLFLLLSFLLICVVVSGFLMISSSEYEVSDIDPLLLREVKKIAREATKEKMTKGKLAETIKNYLDKKSGGDSVWCCIVGGQFGGVVTYQNGTGASFFVGDINIMIFRP